MFHSLLSSLLTPTCEFAKAPAPGVLSYEAALGERVEKDQVIAWLIDPAAEDPNGGRRAQPDPDPPQRRRGRYCPPRGATAP